MKYLGLALIAASLGVSASAQTMGPRDVDALRSSAPSASFRYGPAPEQVADLRLPSGKGPFPVVVVVHGGCWTKGFATRQNTAALASALTRHGYATWNIDYRQVGDVGAGWPGTFNDWAAGTDYLRRIARVQHLDLSRVGVIGHSAGAHAALWIASRAGIPANSPIGSRRPLPVRIAVAIDGPGALAPFVGPDAEICGKPVIAPLIGGTPSAQPARYRMAAPIDLLPTRAQQAMIASSVLTAADAEIYRKAALAKGQRVDVLDVHDGGHFDIIAPGSKAWAGQVEPFLLKELAPLRR